jgi:hypothetical protein
MTGYVIAVSGDRSPEHLGVLAAAMGIAEALAADL